MNAGILDAVRAGVVTSVSAMVNMPAFERGMRLLRELPDPPSVGLHLVLTAGVPVAAATDVPALVNHAGHFHALSALAFRALTLQVPSEEIARETSAQLERLRKSWPDVTHVDGHQHAHALPTVWPAVRRVAGPLMVRAPSEPVFQRGRGGRARRLLLGAAWRMGGRRAHGAPLVRGIGMHGSRAFLAELLRLIDDVPPGLTELIVHPGKADVATLLHDPYDTPRETELAALLSRDFRARLVLRDPWLTDFRRERAPGRIANNPAAA